MAKQGGLGAGAFIAIPLILVGTLIAGMCNERYLQLDEPGVKAVTTRISRVNVLRRGQPLDGARAARRYLAVTAAI